MNLTRCQRTKLAHVAQIPSIWMEFSLARGTQQNGPKPHEGGLHIFAIVAKVKCSRPKTHGEKQGLCPKTNVEKFSPHRSDLSVYNPKLLGFAQVMFPASCKMF